MFFSVNSMQCSFYIIILFYNTNSSHKCQCLNRKVEISTVTSSKWFFHRLSTWHSDVVGCCGTFHNCLMLVHTSPRYGCCLLTFKTYTIFWGLSLAYETTLPGETSDIMGLLPCLWGKLLLWHNSHSTQHQIDTRFLV